MSLWMQITLVMGGCNRLLEPLLKKVLYLGTKGLNATQVHSTRVTNLLAILAIPLTLANGLLQVTDFPVDPLINTRYLTILSSAYLATLLWNRLGLHQFAKTWICSAFWFDICYSSTYMFGIKSGIYWHLLLVFPIAFLMWPASQARQRYIMLLITVALFVWVVNWQGTPMVQLSIDQQQAMWTSVFLDTAVLLSFAAYIFVSDTSKLQRELAYLASYDALTGILNRREFEHRLNLRLKTLPAAMPCALLLFDIDNFKHINDQFGHHAGDEALKHLVNRARPLIPTAAFFGRLGGDEFCVFCPAMPQKQVRELAQALLDNVIDPPLVVDDHTIAFTISIGIAFEHQRQNLQRLFVAADNAMYKSKRKGKSCVEMETY